MYQWCPEMAISVNGKEVTYSWKRSEQMYGKARPLLGTTVTVQAFGCKDFCHHMMTN